MIGCLRTRVRKQPIIALYFECETVPQDECRFCCISKICNVVILFNKVNVRKLVNKGPGTKIFSICQDFESVWIQSCKTDKCIFVH